MRRFRSRTIFANASLTLRVVEFVDFQCAEELGAHFVVVQSKPFAMIVDKPGGRSAMDLESNPLAMEKLAAAIHDIDDLPAAD